MDKGINNKKKIALIIIAIIIVIIPSKLQTHETKHSTLTYDPNLYTVLLASTPSPPPTPSPTPTPTPETKPEPYTNIQTIENPEGLLVICDKNNSLSWDYVPKELTEAGKMGGISLRLTPDAAEAFREMQEAMQSENLKIYIRSAYRSYQKQYTLYDLYCHREGQDNADKYSARAGHSEHQLGLSVDILQTTNYSVLGDAEFENSEEYQWLCANAYKYGYILRYPKDGEDVTGYLFEPWHWRFVGKTAALEMKEQHINTLEEYTRYNS